MPLIENADELQVKMSRFDNLFDYYRADDTGLPQDGADWRPMEPSELRQAIVARMPGWSSMCR